MCIKIFLEPTCSEYFGGYIHTQNIYINECKKWSTKNSFSVTSVIHFTFLRERIWEKSNNSFIIHHLLANFVHITVEGKIAWLFGDYSTFWINLKPCDVVVIVSIYWFKTTMVSYIRRGPRKYLVKWTGCCNYHLVELIDVDM